MAQPNLQPALDQQVLPWVIRRITNTLNLRDSIRYENSLYGPLLSLLSCIFSVNRSFILKPQGVLRREYDGGFDSQEINVPAAEQEIELDFDLYDEGGTSFRIQMDEEAVAGSDVETGLVHFNALVSQGLEIIDTLAPLDGSELDMSTDSYRGFVSSRDGGRAKPGDLGYPDFIGAKATEYPNNDTIITIIEVKKANQSLREADFQLQKYMVFAAPKQRAPILKCFLISGDITHVWTLGPGADAEPVNTGVEYPTDSLQFRTDLHEIAGQFW